jgi:hypothetical protein
MEVIKPSLSVGKGAWRVGKFLPVGSFVNYSYRAAKGLIKQSELKGLLHFFYAIIPFAYGFSALAYDSLNPVDWWNTVVETNQKSQQEAQFYSDTWFKAADLVDTDGVRGITNLSELDDLYSRAGIGTTFDNDYLSLVGNRQGVAYFNFKAPELTLTDLEKVIDSFDHE